VFRPGLAAAALAMALSACQTMSPPEPRPVSQADRQCASPIRYPSQAQRIGAEGVAEVRAQVELDGSLSSVQVVKSSGQPSLDAEALRYFQQCRFAPVSGNYKPVLVRVPVRFQLQ
jgi:TonB family protein